MQNMNSKIAKMPSKLIMNIVSELVVLNIE